MEYASGLTLNFVLEVINVVGIIVVNVMHNWNIIFWALQSNHLKLTRKAKQKHLAEFLCSRHRSRIRTH